MRQEEPSESHDEADRDHLVAAGNMLVANARTHVRPPREIEAYEGGIVIDPEADVLAKDRP
jgi:hypothetical protein